MSPALARERCSCGASFEFSGNDEVLGIVSMRKWRTEHHHDPSMSADILELVTKLSRQIKRERDRETD